MSTADAPPPAQGRADVVPALPSGLTAAIATLAGQYAQPRAACVEALKCVQQHFGCVDDARLRALASLLGMSAEELDGVATYYNLIYRRPVGRHVIHLCDSVSCWLRGEEQLCAQLEQRLGIRLGETTADRRFTLLPIVCLGYCDHAPALMIDQTLHGDVQATALDPLLEHFP